MKIQILIDNKKSWIVPYAITIVEDLILKNHEAHLIYNHEDVTEGDVLFLLSCEKKFTKFKFNKHNLVIHESKLPKGKGWSPLTWQIIEGENEITITLFEAEDKIDSGEIFLQKKIILNGYELIDELREKQANTTKDLITEFIQGYNLLKSRKQQGEETFYPKRQASDSEINIHKSIKSQFNLFRVVDNERYPAFFYMNGHKYILKIFKSNE